MSDEKLTSDLDVGVPYEPQPGIFKRLIHGFPIGALFLGVLVNSWVNASIAFLFWSIDTDYMKKTLYYAIFCSVFGGLILAYLSFCVLSRQYLKNQVVGPKTQFSYTDQLKENLRILFSIDLFQNTMLRIILLLIFVAFCVVLAYYIIWGLLILIGLFAIQ